MKIRAIMPPGDAEAVLAAFRAGAPGVLLSRKYSEMKRADLSAAGEAIREQVGRLTGIEIHFSTIARNLVILRYPDARATRYGFLVPARDNLNKFLSTITVSARLFRF
jgi:hypothetical protein